MTRDCFAVDESVIRASRSTGDISTLVTAEAEEPAEVKRSSSLEGLLDPDEKKSK